MELEEYKYEKAHVLTCPTIETPRSFTNQGRFLVIAVMLSRAEEYTRVSHGFLADVSHSA